MRYNRAFTVTEVLVVIAIIGIIATAVIFNATSASKRSRDIDRQADLRTLQSAIELYKQKYGRYPDGCNGPNLWSGQVGTSFACNRNNTIYTQFIGTGQYIFGHQDKDDWDRDGNSTEIFSFSPEFIPRLPVDKKRPDQNSGYVYTVNSAGTVYKLEARRTVETETVTYAHPFKSCDVDNTSRDTSQPQFYSTAPLCNKVFSVGGQTDRKPSQCEETSAIFRSTYGVWGGNAPGTGVSTYSSADNTEDIVCF